MNESDAGIEGERPRIVEGRAANMYLQMGQKLSHVCTQQVARQFIVVASQGLLWMQTVRAVCTGDRGVAWEVGGC